MVHPNAAAINIGAQFDVVAVGDERDPEPVRSFRSFTKELHELVGWLKQVGIHTVAMESTGVYRIPVFEVLEASSFEVVIVNARDAKNVPGRKTDVNDAQWLQQLHSYGLLRASFRPSQDVATLRSYLRQRERLLEYAASHIQHMQKALTLMNVQLHQVVEDVTGATGMKIIRAIVAGERNADTRSCGPISTSTVCGRCAECSAFIAAAITFGNVSQAVRASASTTGCWV